MKQKTMKQKTKSSIKKRFKITGSGRIKAFDMGKRDHMLHKSSSSLRRKGSTILCKVSERKLEKFGGF